MVWFSIVGLIVPDDENNLAEADGQDGGTILSKSTEHRDGIPCKATVVSA